MQSVRVIATPAGTRLADRYGALHGAIVDRRIGERRGDRAARRRQRLCDDPDRGRDAARFVSAPVMPLTDAYALKGLAQRGARLWPGAAVGLGRVHRGEPDRRRCCWIALRAGNLIWLIFAGNCVAARPPPCCSRPVPREAAPCAVRPVPLTAICAARRSSPSPRPEASSRQATRSTTASRRSTGPRRASAASPSACCGRSASLPRSCCSRSPARLPRAVGPAVLIAHRRGRRRAALGRDGVRSARSAAASTAAAARALVRRDASRHHDVSQPERAGAKPRRRAGRRRDREQPDDGRGFAHRRRAVSARAARRPTPRWRRCALPAADLRFLGRADHAHSAPECGRRPDRPGCPRSAARSRDRPRAAAAPSRSTTRARCASSIAGAIESDVATMQPTIRPKPSRSASAAIASASVRPAGLVELDVDRIILADERGQRGAVMHALVGADRDRAHQWQRAPRRRPPASGCSISVTPPAAHAARLAARLSGAPGLVGVDDQLGIGRCGAHRGDPLGVALPAELHLQQLARRGLARPPAPSRRACRARSCRRSPAPAAPASSGKRIHRLAGNLRLEIPERAIERVARRARRHRVLQRLPRQAARQRATHCLDRGRNACDRLAIARIGHALAAPGVRVRRSSPRPQPPPRSSPRARS